MEKLYFIFSLVLLQVCFVLSYNSALYCRDDICPGDDLHVACRRGRGRVRSSATPSKCPPNVEKIPITKSLRSQIVHEMNSVRDKIAKGEMPGFRPAVRMLSVRWDKELAKLAELKVMLCDQENDECRNTKDFKHVGQISSVATTVNKTYEPKEFVKRIFKSWTNNSQACDSNTMSSFQLTTNNQDCRSFAQLSQEFSNHIGCAMLAGHDGSLKTTYAICNFARGNSKGQKVYESGESARSCLSGVNLRYPHLCSERELLDINE